MTFCLHCLATVRATVRLLPGLVLFVAAAANADDWPQWGGPNRDCVWRETGIVKTLPKGQLPRMWSTPIKDGYSSPAIADGRVYVTDMPVKHRAERVLCLDAETGNVLWKHQYKAQYTVQYPNGPRATPVVEGNRVYTIGTQGHMFCLNAKNGDVIWQKNFVEDYGTQLPIWGMASTPLIEGNQIITLVGGADGACVVSFDKLTGNEIWRAIDDREVGYAPPVIKTFGDTRQVIIWHPQSVTSLNPRTGHVYWDIPFKVRYGLCIPMPQISGNRIFLTSFYNGPRMITASTSEPTAKITWAGSKESEKDTDGLHSIMPTPIFDGKHIYGVGSYGQLRCLNAQTGDRLWSTFAATGEARWWNAFLVPNGDRVFLNNEQGELIIAKLSPKGYEEISRAQLLKPTRLLGRERGKVRMVNWTHPSFAMKSIFARNDKEIIRVNLAAE